VHSFASCIASKMSGATPSCFCCCQSLHHLGAAVAVLLVVASFHMWRCRCCSCQPAVGPQHAELLQKNKQVFLRALQGDFVFDR
jgi:hypothetical protein